MNEYEPLDRVLISVNIMPSYNFTQITCVRTSLCLVTLLGCLTGGSEEVMMLDIATINAIELHDG